MVKRSVAKCPVCKMPMGKCSCPKRVKKSAVAPMLAGLGKGLSLKGTSGVAKKLTSIRGLFRPRVDTSVGAAINRMKKPTPSLDKMGSAMAEAFLDELEKTSALSNKALNSAIKRNSRIDKILDMFYSKKRLKRLKVTGKGIDIWGSRHRGLSKEKSRLNTLIAKHQGRFKTSGLAAPLGSSALAAIVGGQPPAALKPPSSGFGKGEEGAPHREEMAMAEQNTTEHAAEEARMVGSPKSDRLQKAVSKIQMGRLKKVAAVTYRGKHPLFNHDITERGIVSDKPLSIEEKKEFYRRADKEHGRKSKKEE